MSDQERLKRVSGCVSLVRLAFEELERAKEDCKAKVDAAIGTFVASEPSAVTDADKKSIKKIAKALALDKVDELKGEVAADVDILSETGICSQSQLTIYGPLQRARAAGEQLVMDYGEGQSPSSVMQ